mmetsp:Transcript_4197/g.3519  ORF Transcript_4197/g.3519 Transcript_4197/m.3519 type:complete len:231 (+) Transcript_4197:292-984(+)
MATELAEKGSLFDYIQASKGFTEQLTRTIFGQILESVEYIHSQGIYHRDIKAENIFLDRNYQIKLGDFGFATNDVNDNLYCGSGYYMAPEVTLKKKYNCATTDIFSLGVLLFFMVTGKYPFIRANDNDCKFKLLSEGKIKLFWRTSVRCRNKLRALSPEFIQLVTMCLSINSIERPSVSEIKNHPWFACTNDEYSSIPKVETPYNEDVFNELSKLEPDIMDPMDQYISYH